ncbi:uncharacterized protein Bfra_001224 [Botrytis fragariae]|uniref:Uncharacterized protein n=1 Tax=Botrytis fragariae TaxID=1964551 RepID=A0A8H6ELT1_9HELO|nr:uncharacterized protein Bfra_001224 [Botrytis fragariae]KAF5876869.1 hypothetical protein Bfra_001224 [Botrytis fragariae]
MGIYTTNVKEYADSFGLQKKLRNRGANTTTKDDGSGEYIYHNASPNSAENLFVVPTDAGAFVELLRSSKPRYLSEIWGQVTCEQFTVEAHDRARPGGLGREAAESMARSVKFGWGDLVLRKDLDSNVKLTSIKEHIESEDWSVYK